MRYAILIYGDERSWASMSREAGMAEMAAYQAYSEALRDAGVMVAGDPLEPTASATTIRVRDGKTELIDGPFAETKEQFGGYYILEVPDADAAIQWAARCPGARTGSIEVRPIMEIPAPVA